MWPVQGLMDWDMVLVLNWSRFPCVGGGGRSWMRCGSTFVKMIGRHYQRVVAKDSTMPNILCCTMKDCLMLLLRNIYFSYTWLVERAAKTDWCCPAWGQVRPGCRNFLVTGEVLCCRMWIFFMATRFLSSWVCFLVTGSSILMTRKRCYLIINWLIEILYHKWLCLFWSLSYSWVSCRWWDKIEFLEPGIPIISHLETLPPNHQCLTSSAVSSVQENWFLVLTAKFFSYCFTIPMWESQGFYISGT